MRGVVFFSFCENRAMSAGAVKLLQSPTCGFCDLGRMGGHIYCDESTRQETLRCRNTKLMNFQIARIPAISLLWLMVQKSG